MNKLLILLTTGMPGLHKLIIFFICERILSINELGDFSSDYSILIVLSYIYAIGWSGLILTRVSKLDDQRGKEYLYSILHIAIAYYFVSFLVIVILFAFGLISSFLGAVLFTVAWMCYQITRHYHLSKTQHKLILTADVVIILILSALIFLSVPPLMAIATACFSGSLMLIKGQVSPNRKSPSKEDKLKSFQISANVFLYSAILMGLPFIVGSTGRSEMAALIGYFISILSIILLLPRGISLYFIPQLAVVPNDKITQLFKRFYIINTLVIFIMTVGLILGYFMLTPLINTLSFDVSSNESLLLSLLISMTIGALSVPASSLLLAKEYTMKLLMSSGIQFLICVIGVLLFYYNSINTLTLINIIILGGISKILITYNYALKLIGRES